MDNEAIKLHKEKRGKLEIKSKVALATKKDLSLAYTPGVAAVSSAIAKDKSKVYDYTIKQNSVAVVTDGSAVLGLGNIGPEAALPVMEGKAILFKEFADIDAYPICLATQNSDEIISIVKNIAPGFGGINLEDISAPRCFEIEQALQEIGIPVMHDDQHGTAVVVLAGLINATKVVGKELTQLKVVINGSGAAGMAIAKLLLCLGYEKKTCTPVKEIILCDSKGIIYERRNDLNKYKKELAKATNRKKIKGTLEDALRGADVFIGVSVGGALKKEYIKKMADKPIIFAMANPTPEIMPDEAKGAAVIATGRSDFPNQINNVLAFPGIFRGALDAKATQITCGMKLAAAHAIADCVAKPTKENIIPSPLEREVAKKVSEAVRKVWDEENK
ncbi:MAG TPA: malic enzyme-like NAD(P)-binding protein [archaeon]|nr:malic enzyme-like NAD(P)-binding protein [archaeon]